MALAFDPPDLIERAASEEAWTVEDRYHVARVISEAFEQQFKAELIQTTSIGLGVYRTNVVNYDSVLFEEAAKPTLNALERLSRKLFKRRRGQALLEHGESAD